MSLAAEAHRISHLGYRNVFLLQQLRCLNQTDITESTPSFP